MKKLPLVPLALVAFSVCCAIFSKGFLEADEITHFLKAQQFTRDWKEVLDIWGRPACTGIYGAASLLGGLVAARLMAVVVTVGIGCGTVMLWSWIGHGVVGERPGIGQFERYAPAWLWALLYAQPLFLLNSYAVMTEMLLACAWVWAAVLMAQRRVVLAGLVLGLGALARPEGWLALAVWPVVLLFLRRELAVSFVRGGLSFLLSLLGTAVWWVAGGVSYGDFLWMVHRFPWAAHSQYGKTGMLFVASSLVALGLWMWVPVVVGAMAGRREKRWVWLAAAPVGAFFLLHGFLGVFGLMGAMSLPRYFVAVSPFVAVLALRGLIVLEQRSRRPRWVRKGAVVLAVFPGIMLLVLGQVPTPKGPELTRLDAAISGFERAVPKSEWGERLIAEHPYVFYRTGIPLTAASFRRVSSREAIRTAAIGTVVITDSTIWEYEGRPTLAGLEAWGYQQNGLVASAVAAVPERFDLSMIGASGQGVVGMWVKVR